MEAYHKTKMPRAYKRAVPSYEELLRRREKANARARAYNQRPEVKEKKKAYAKTYRVRKANPMINISEY